MISFSSCDIDSVNTTPPETQEPNNSQILVSITNNSTWVNYFETTNFTDGKITDIPFSDVPYHLYSHTGDLVTQIQEYNASANLLFTNTFSYDAEGKLVGKVVLPKLSSTEWENYVTYE